MADANVGADVGKGELRRRSEIENEFDKIVPVELGKTGRIEKRRYSALSNHSRSSVGSTAKSVPLKQGKRISVIVIPKAILNAEPIDYVEKGFCCSPERYRKFAWGLCSTQAVLMVLWIVSICLAMYYWPAPHFTGRFFPSYLTNSSGRTRIIVFTCLGSEPIISFLLLGASLLLAKRGIRWIRIFYVINTWLSILLLIGAVHILIFAANTTEQDLEEKLREELRKYDDSATSQGILQFSTTKVDRSSQEDWDQIQDYFGCCGIHSEVDWYNVRNFFDRDDMAKDPNYWRVPQSCCRSRSTADIRNCVRYPAEHRDLIHHRRGCAKKLLALLKNLGTYGVIQILVNWFLQVLSILLMMSYYGILRYEDGSGYRWSWRTFQFELFFLFIFREQRFKAKGNYNSEWLMPVNKVIDMGQQNRKNSQTRKLEIQNK